MFLPSALLYLLSLGLLLSPLLLYLDPQLFLFLVFLSAQHLLPLLLLYLDYLFLSLHLLDLDYFLLLFPLQLLLHHEYTPLPLQGTHPQTLLGTLPQSQTALQHVGTALSLVLALVLAHYELTQLGEVAVVALDHLGVHLSVLSSLSIQL